MLIEGFEGFQGMRETYDAVLFVTLSHFLIKFKIRSSLYTLKLEGSPIRNTDTNEQIRLLGPIRP